MKRGVWIIIIIAIIVIGVIFGMSMSKNDKQNVQAYNNAIEKNKITNTEVSNEVNEIKENVTQNEIDENTANEVNTETFEEQPKTEQEKAVQIVERDYGKNANVKFSIEGIDEKGRQIVVVRNIQTTEALAFYFVNVSYSTFTKKEMN